MLVEFFEGDHEREGLANFRELILTRSCKTGKSYALELAIIRSLYVLSCFDHPQFMFGLSPSLPLAYIYLSVTQRGAQITGFHHIKDIIDNSPYFQEELKRRKNIATRLEFTTNHLTVLRGSGTGHIMRSYLFGAAFDEANFAKPGAWALTRFKEATDTYLAVMNRRVSRFLQKRQLFGFSGVASSSETRSSFVEQRVAAANTPGNQNILVVEARL